MKTGKIKSVAIVLVVAVYFLTFISCGSKDKPKDKPKGKSKVEAKGNVEKIQYDEKGNYTISLHWNDDGSLDKMITLLDGKTTEATYDKGEIIKIAGEEVLKQATLSVSGAKKEEYQNAFMYTKDKTLIFGELYANNGKLYLRSNFENNRISRSGIDSNFDGIFDIVHFYENGIAVRYEKDSDFDGEIDASGALSAAEANTEPTTTPK
ncbi:MAG: hypothetical protein GY858_09680 [Candidatus Omnitrophica bacterium]|nr:hypothetical protein [Candidatus Omnitrophota bacterium]